MRFVRNAPIRGRSEARPITIVYLDQDSARTWHNEVQPLIRETSQKRYRPDEKWNWPALMHLLPRAELLAGRRCYGYAVMVATDEEKAVPVALSLVVEKFALLQDQEPGTFLWFAASAPAEAFEALRVPRLGMLGQILVDTVIVTSLREGMEGRITLHADPGGDAYLPDFYMKTCGLLRVPQSATFRGVRKNDGRYYYTTPGIAKTLLERMDRWR